MGLEVIYGRDGSIKEGGLSEPKSLVRSVPQPNNSCISAPNLVVSILIYVVGQVRTKEIIYFSLKKRT